MTSSQEDASCRTQLQGSISLQILATASVSLAIVTDGMHYGWTSPSLPQLVNNTDCSKINLCMTTDQGGWLTVMLLIGTVIGATLAAVIIDLIGRKIAIIVAAMPFFLAWILIAFATNINMHYAAKFIAGLADGIAFSVLPIYLGEISHPRIRGLLGSSISTSWVLGYLLINITGSYLSIRDTALVSAIIPAILVPTFICMPESSYYLIMKGNIEEAKLSLQRFGKLNNVDEELGRLKEAVRLQNENRGKLLDLFTVSSNRKAVLIIVGLRGFQQLTGAMAITFYTNSIFAEAGADIPAHYVTIMCYSIQLLVTLFSAGSVDKIGRKPLLIVSMLGSLLALLVAGSYFAIKNNGIVDTKPFAFTPLIAVILLIIMTSIGMQNIPILMLGELFPTNMKGFAIFFVNVCYTVVASAASKFLQVAREKYGIHVALFTFSVCSVLGLMFIIFFVPETKGKTLEEVQAQLKGESEKTEVSDENQISQHDNISATLPSKRGTISNLTRKIRNSFVFEDLNIQ